MSMYLTPDDLLIARRLFALQVYKRDGQSYEDFFTEIMRYHDPAFRAVKPQGPIGDRKNDGFIDTTGTYFQVYAPEDSSHKQTETIEKIVTDFAGLKKNWDKALPINEYYFVLNDRYKGAYPTVHAELLKIKNDHKLTTCKTFLAHQLEDIFMQLPHDKIEAVLGKVPSAENISLNVSVLNDVVEHLINIEVGYSVATIPVNPNFEDKIAFNNLSQRVATLLRFSSFQEGTLKEWFQVNSNFAKDKVRQTFNNLYKEGMVKFALDQNKEDLIFFYILDNAYPDKRKYFQDAVLVLMSYYFGYCDIFEEPLVPQKIVF